MTVPASFVAAVPASSTAGIGVSRLARTAGALGIAWNLFGLYQCAASLGATPEVLMARGMNASQAALYLGLPGWMTLAFAVGVCAGAAGAGALAFGRRLAVPLLALSLAAYVVLYGGDAAFGLFDAIPGQWAILSVVLAIAVALLTVALAARRGQRLR